MPEPLHNCKENKILFLGFILLFLWNIGKKEKKYAVDL